MTHRNRGELGKFAETHFHSIATRAGFECHPPSCDRRGWDFIVEFPENLHGEFAPTEVFNRAVEHKGLVQVKGTSGAESRSISLQQWERFAKDPRPCFFYILEVNDQREPDTAFLVHVDRELVHEVAERLAGLDEADMERFRKLEKVLNWSECVGFDPDDPDLLREKLFDYAGTSPARYASQKREWMENAGVSKEPSFGGTAKISAENHEDLLERLNEFYLGHTDRLEFDRFEAFERRFGEKVCAPEELQWQHGRSKAWASMKGSPGTLVVSASDQVRRSPVRIDCTVYSNVQIVEGLELGDAHLAFRAESERVEFSIGNGEVSFSLRPFSDIDEPVSLSKMADAGRVARLMNSAAESGEPLTIQLLMEDGAVDSPEVSIPARKPQQLEEQRLERVLATALRAERAARRANLDNLTLTPKVLVSQAQSLAFANLLCEPSQGHRIVFSSNVETDDDWGGESVAATLVVAVEIDDFVVCAAGALRGTAEVVSHEDEWTRVKAESTTSVLIVEPRSFPRSTTPDSKIEGFLHSARKEVESWAEREDVHLIDVDDFIATYVPNVD